METNQVHLVEEKGYCIDASSLFRLEPYHQDIFTGLWTDIETLINDHRLISPKAVLDEFDDKYPDSKACKKWFKAHNKIFIDNQDIWTKAKLIMSRHPKLTNPNHPQSKGDYFVIALAQYMNGWTVVTEEHTPRKTTIKKVCSEMGIPCIDLYTFFKKCKWKY